MTRESHQIVALDCGVHAPQSRSKILLGFLAVVSTFLVGTVALHLDREESLVALLAVGLPWLVWYVAYDAADRQRRLQPGPRARVVVRSNTLEVDGKVVVTPSKLRGARVLDTRWPDGRARVEVFYGEGPPPPGSGFSWLIDVANEDTANAFVRTLLGTPSVSGGISYADAGGQVAPARRIVLQTTSDDRRTRARALCLGAIPALALVGGMVLAVLRRQLGELPGGLVPLYIVAFIFVASLIAGLVFVVRAARTTLEVGTDGVTVRGSEGTRFHPFDEIESVVANAETVTLTLVSGRSLGFALKESSARDAGVFALREGIARHARSAPPVASLTGRGGKTATAWIADLRALSSGAGYREATVPPEALWNLVEDPDAEPTARAGAAIALRARLDEPGRTRLRIAAEGSASPLVRVVLDQVAGDEASDEAVEQAVNRVDA